MAREPSWQAVAAALADRVQHLAHCEDHRDDAANPDCAPCRDRAAYRMWQRKAGIDPHRAQEDAGEVIDVFAHARGDARYRSFGEADSPASSKSQASLATDSKPPARPGGEGGS